MQPEEFTSRFNWKSRKAVIGLASFTLLLITIALTAYLVQQKIIFGSKAASPTSKPVSIKTDAVNTNSQGLFIWPERHCMVGGGSCSTPYSSEKIQEIARNNDFILRDAVDSDVNNILRQSNPNIKLIGYVNPMFIWNDHEDFIWKYSEIISHQDWLLKNSSNQTMVGTHGGVLLDIGNPAFQQYLATAALNAITQGLNGIYIDDAHETFPGGLYGLDRPINPRTSAPYTDQEWKNDTYRLIKTVYDTVRSIYPNDYNKLVIYNGYYKTDAAAAPPDGWEGDYFIDVADGAISEGFIHFYTQSSNPMFDHNENVWVEEIERLKNYQDQGKFIFTISGNSQDNINIYAYASYLMGKGPKSYYNYVGVESSWPGFHINIGTPLANYSKVNNVYQREFSNAKVLANPSSNTYEVSLGSSMYKLNSDGTVSSSPVNNITITPWSGAVFLKRLGTPPTGMPTPTLTPIPTNTPSPTVTPTPLPVGGGSINLARGKTAAASSEPFAGFLANLITDGSNSTRWSSEKQDDEWVYIDLGQKYNISQVVLRWADAYGKDYDIKVSDGGGVWRTVFQRRGFGGGTDIIANLSASGRYISLQGIRRAYPEWWGYSLSEFEVYGTPPNLAIGKPATVSSVEQSSEARDAFFADNLSDGNLSTRWASKPNDYEWVYIDLGERKLISKVVLKWETAYGKDYDIKVSDGGGVWKTVFQRRGFGGGTDTISGLSEYGRYISVQGIKRAYPWWGYSLYEFEVY